nr:immunoglobulin light chain junction region [Macaca mulatta]
DYYCAIWHSGAALF